MSWLQILVHVLPLVTPLVSDVTGAVEAFRNDEKAADKVEQSKRALEDIMRIVQSLNDALHKELPHV